MTYHVNLTHRAGGELEGAADWWAAHRSANQAADWYAGFSAAIERPDDLPGFGGTPVEATTGR